MRFGSVARLVFVPGVAWHPARGCVELAAASSLQHLEIRRPSPPRSAPWDPAICTRLPATPSLAVGTAPRRLKRAEPFELHTACTPGVPG